MNDRVALPQLILCIPGPWIDRCQFLQGLTEDTHGRYLVVGDLFKHAGTKSVFDIEFHPRDENMQAAFSSAGPHWRDSPDMARIDAHRSVVYLLGHGGSDDNIRALMLAVQALLDAGGLGVKVESTGLAHSPDAWRSLCADPDALSGVYHAFVVVVSGRREAYSCGMHSFAMHDVQVLGEDRASALQVAQAFCWYLFCECPAIAGGQTFSCDEQSPVYRISSSQGVDYGPDSLFNNPYGTWQLRSLDA